MATVQRTVLENAPPDTEPKLWMIDEDEEDIDTDEEEDEEIEDEEEDEEDEEAGDAY